ncbi:MAG: DNA internalization-related competence protein ComEC/Rec2 [Candidatus Eisenbacteria bacterium]
MGGRCAIAAVVAVWLGLLVGRGLGLVPVALCLVSLAPLSWLACRAPDRVGTVALLLALALAGVARGGSGQAALLHGPRALEDGLPPRWIQASVVEHPLREAGEPLAIARLTGAAPPLPAGTRLRLRLPAGCDAEWGDTVTAFAALERPPGRRNPGGIDASGTAATAGIAVQGRALVARVARGGGLAAWPRATAARWRRAIERVLDRGLGPESRELVTPLVIGDRSALTPTLGAHLRAAGLTHLLALSGLHVVWLAGLARGLAAALGAGVRGRALAGAACALFYGAIAGPLPSLMRAVTTELASAAARSFGRALDGVQALALSALALLVWAPGWAGDLGFQLSCAATLGLVTVGPWLTESAGRLRALCAPFVPTLAAQLVALPLLLDRFHALPWTSLASNLLAVPVCGLLLAAAWAGAGLECALPGAGRPWFAACEVLAASLRGIADAAARVPGALLATGSEPALPWLAGIGAGLLVLSLPGPRALEARCHPAGRGRVAAVLLGAFASTLALVLAVSARPLTPAPGRWWLVALDVGQGDALALGFADGWWLVDAGPRTLRFDAGEGTVMPFLRWAGVRTLERLALTHDDGDHTGGASAVLRGTRVVRVLVPTPEPGVPGPAARLGALARPVQRCARGDTLHRTPPVIVRWPPAGMPLPDDNAAALVLEVGEASGRALLAADVDSTREDSLAVAPGIAVLKVAHHGSGSSSGARFLARARPALALVTVGKRNAFGHPDPRALARLAAAGATILRTDREGAVWLEMSAAGVRRADWRRGRPLVDACREPRSLAPREPRW